MNNNRIAFWETKFTHLTNITIGLEHTFLIMFMTKTRAEFIILRIATEINAINVHVCILSTEEKKKNRCKIGAQRQTKDVFFLHWFTNFISVLSLNRSMCCAWLKIECAYSFFSFSLSLTLWCIAWEDLFMLLKSRLHFVHFDAMFFIHINACIFVNSVFFFLLPFL